MTQYSEYILITIGVKTYNLIGNVGVLIWYIPLVNFVWCQTWGEGRLHWPLTLTGQPLTWP